MSEAHMDRRRLMRSFAVAGGAAATAHLIARTPAEARTIGAGPILKPLPPEWFIDHGTNAEMRWEAMRGQGTYVPNDRFFVRNHTRTPVIDARTWRLELFGTALRGAPTADRPVRFTYGDLLALPSVSVGALVECAGNARSFFGTQQGTPASGTPWRLGGVGLARWRGVRLSTVLRRAGLLGSAVDVQPEGLDPDFATGSVNLGRVRRPIPIAKALDDVLLAYEMNGEPLPPDHGFPVRVIVPGWVGISSIKWVGRIEVSSEPLYSPWSTQFYRLFGPAYPPEGSEPITEQVTKSAFELPWDATVPAGRTVRLTGRSWSPHHPIRRVEVSVDGGGTWRQAHLSGTDRGWRRWSFTWRPENAGPATLVARAVDATGAAQPARTAHNTFGYLFGAAVHHPVLVTS